MLMYGVVWVSLIWMYWTEVRRAEVIGPAGRRLQPQGRSAVTGRGATHDCRQPDHGKPAARRGKLLTIWTPEDKAFWEQQGQAIANLNLWISVPRLFLAFAVWQLWSVVAVNLNALGFRFTTNQLFWLAAAPALSGATLRIFYSFMVPIFGGRRWTAISTASRC